MTTATAMKSSIMSPKALALVVILISLMCGTVTSNLDQPAGISHSNNSSHSQSSSSQSGSLSASSPEKSSDTSQSQVSVHSNATVTKGEAKPVSASKPDELSVKAPSGNASAPLPNEAEGIVHSSDESDDLSKKLNPEALMRGFYVFVGLSIIVMAYIAWKSFGKRPAQIHRYGVVGNRDDLEMAPLDSDDGDDDDTTHFDISSHRLQT